MVESIAAVVTAIGVVFAGIQLRAGQLRRHRQFESLYVQRYCSLLDRLSPEALRSEVPFEHLGPEDRKGLATGTPCRHLNELTTTPDGTDDPLSLGPVRRWFRGLG